MAPPVGFEPTLPPPEGGALSPELRGLSEQNPTQRALDRGNAARHPQVSRAPVVALPLSVGTRDVSDENAPF